MKIYHLKDIIHKQKNVEMSLYVNNNMDNDTDNNTDNDTDNNTDNDTDNNTIMIKTN